LWGLGGLRGLIGSISSKGWRYVLSNFGLIEPFVFSGTLRILKCSNPFHRSGEGLGKRVNISIKHPHL